MYPQLYAIRLVTILASLFSADWMDGLPELNVQVLELGGGTATEQNAIYLAENSISPEVLFNNNTYPLLVETLSDGTNIIFLDKMETTPTSITDDEVMGRSYDVIDTVNRTHAISLNNAKVQKAAHAMAPQSNAGNNFVIKATGAPRSGQSRKTLTYADIVTLQEKFDDALCPIDGRRLVLCTAHWADLELDRDNFGDKFINYQKGTILEVAGFKVYKSAYNPRYNAAGTTKLAYGQVPGEGEYAASFAFYEENVAKKTGLTKPYMKMAKDHPTDPTNQLNYRHYFVCLPKTNRWLGAVTSTD